MSKSLPYILLANGISITLANGDNHIINSSHPNFAQVISNIKAKNWDAIEGLIDIPKAIAKASSGKVEVFNNAIQYNGKPVHSYLATRILDLMAQGFDIQPWVRFMDRLYSNPDSKSIEQLYPFLERAKLPITPDGYFLAYKYVRKDYKDCHTGTFDNRPGKIVREDRKLCDNNPNNHCSKGLHFCAKEYLPNYGNGTSQRVVIVKVNPRDVVSVPNDHNFQKARACEYIVVGELDEDYTIDDMQKNTVLPDPSNKKQVNAKVKKQNSVSTGPSELQKRIVRPGTFALTVRQAAKNNHVTNADIVNSAGVYYKIFSSTSSSIGSRLITLTNAGNKLRKQLIKEGK